MTDLSHWDFATSFTGTQAAALILGLDPNDAKTPKEPQPVLDRMRQCYGVAHRYYLSDCDPDRPPVDLPASMLESSQMLEIDCKVTYCGLDSSEFVYWLEGKESEFDQQSFTPNRLIYWLDAIGLKSKYVFKSERAKAANAHEKPLAKRERDTLLKIIGALVELIQSPKEGRSSDAAVIGEILENYGDKAGISERTLQKKFALAKRALQND